MLNAVCLLLLEGDSETQVSPGLSSGTWHLTPHTCTLVDSTALWRLWTLSCGSHMCFSKLFALFIFNFSYGRATGHEDCSLF